MGDDYRLGFNYDGIIKLTYRSIIGFLSVRFGYFIWSNFSDWATWFMSLDGIDASAIKDIHLTVASFASTALGTIILYRILLRLVKTYIVTRKLRKPKEDRLSPRNTISKQDEEPLRY